MKVFVATSYSSQVNYETGGVFPEYRDWLEGNLNLLQEMGHTVFCALRADGYRINEANPAEAFRLDEREIAGCDAMLAIVTDKVSAGVQTEIGIAVGLHKRLIIAHEPEHPLAYFNNALIRADKATELILPILEDPFIIK